MTGTFEEFTEYGVRWTAGDFTTVQPCPTERGARDFAQIINPTGDARAEIVARTVTHTPWQPINQPSEVPA